MAAVDVDQGGDDVVLASLSRDEVHRFALGERHGLPSLGRRLILVRADVVLVGLLLVLLLLTPVSVLLGQGHQAWRLRLGGLRPRAWQRHVLLIVQLLIQFEIIVIEDDLYDALEGVMPLIEELLEGIRDFFKHQR